MLHCGIGISLLISQVVSTKGLNVQPGRQHECNNPVNAPDQESRHPERACQILKTMSAHSLKKAIPFTPARPIGRKIDAGIGRRPASRHELACTRRPLRAFFPASHKYECFILVMGKIVSIRHLASVQNYHGTSRAFSQSGGRKFSTFYQSICLLINQLQDIWDRQVSHAIKFSLR